MEKSVFKQRRSQRHLQEFLHCKRQLESTQAKVDSVSVAPEQSQLVGVPIVEHPPADIDLVNCESVFFEMDGNTPGVRVAVNDGDEETWFWVARRRCGQRDRFSGSNSGSEGELDIGSARGVTYEERNDIPGISIN